MTRISRILATLLLLASVGSRAAQENPSLPRWQPGELDIHHIVTGRGNATFFVFPDGTTMLVDAGAAGDGIPFTEPRPHAGRPPGAWIAHYIRQVHPGAEQPQTDYAVLTHFHADHMGGITQLADDLPIGTLIDRAWPDYEQPVPYRDPGKGNHLRFVEQQQRVRGMKIERIRVGRADQIRLRRGADRYPDFEVRNVAANGEVWTGRNDETRQLFPPLDQIAAEDRPTENMCSIALRLRYGLFDYFTGGDMPGIPDAGAPVWHGIEGPVARAIGPTDVHVVNHHGSIDPASPEFLATLRSRVIILPAWSATHPSADALKRILTARLYPGPRDVLATVIREPTKAAIGSRIEQLKSDHGHVVVRVAAGGRSYRVFVLDDLSETPKVLSSHGPYESR